MRNKNRRRRGSRADGGASWISYSDMMAALVLLFVLVLSVSMFYHNTQIETKQAALDEQAALLAAQTIELTSKEEELAAALLTLASQQAELDASSIVLATKEEELEAANLLLAAKQAELDAASATLLSQQALLASQQEKLDALVGVRTSIVKDLTTALADANVKAKVDPNTGDIVLESNVFFEYGKNEITQDGKAFLRSFVPVYLGVLLKPEYSDYLGEVIIQGHTDTSGTYTFNLQLSQKRALSVAKFCLEIDTLTKSQQQLLRDIMTVTGKSFSNPVYNADGTVNAEASRRVEFKFGLRDADMINEMRTILAEDDGAEIVQ